MKCISCGKEMDSLACGFCGAEKKLNKTSGNLLWMKNGRVISAPVEEEEARERMYRDYPKTLPTGKGD